MQEIQNSSSSFTPRDIFGPTATVIGLLIAAVAFLYSTSLNTNTLQELTDLILFVILFYALSAGFSAFYVLLHYRIFWRLAIGLYPFSWVILAFTAINLLISLAYKESLLQLFGINSITLPEFVTVLTMIFIGIAVIGAYLSMEQKILRALRSKGVNTEGFKEGFDEARIYEANPEVDIRSAFLDVYINIEKMLRELVAKNRDKLTEQGILKSTMNLGETLNATRIARMLERLGVINAQTYSAIDDLRPLRNAIVHGRYVSQFSIRKGMTLCAIVRNTLIRLIRDDSRAQN